MSIDERQNDLISQFQLLEGNMEMSLEYIMELGNALPAISEDNRIEENIVKGCQSKVWLHAQLLDDKIHFDADSNTAITKGLVAMLLSVVNQQTPDAVLNANLYFPEKIGMNRFIGTQRSNGFAAMIKQIKFYALALKVQNTHV